MGKNAMALLRLSSSRWRYSRALRSIGQSLESLELKALDVKSHGDDYVVQGWSKGPSLSMDFERYYTPDEIEKLEAEARTNRKLPSTPPYPLKRSEILRLAGNYVDRMGGRLIRVSWQDQSDKIQSVTIQYESFHGDRGESGEPQIATIEELCVHVYKRRKKIAAGSEKHAHRPWLVGNNVS